MDASALTEIGLTPSEVATYVALLELGSAHAGEIAERTSLANSALHRAINQLVAKGLASYTKEGKVRSYQATSPDRLGAIAEEKKRTIDKMLPQLKKLQARSLPAQNASVYKGVRGIGEVYAQLIAEPSREYNSFGGGMQCAERMGLAWWVNLHTRRVAKRLRSRQVFDESVRAMGGDILSKRLTRARFLPAAFASFQETVIVGDLVAITVFSEQPYSMQLRDASVAASYKRYYELLWKQAKE